MKMTRNSTKHTTTATLRPMLMPALLFWVDPVLDIATMARMRAGIENARQKRELPQHISVKMEKMSAQIAIPEWSSAGGAT